MRDATRCVHHPVISEAGYASLTVPTHRASTIVYPDAAAFLARHARGPDGYSYGLSGTPTTRRLEAQLSALHGGARTLLVPSGQAAASLPMLALLKPGDSVLIPDHVYPPVRAFCRDVLGPLGIGWRAYDPMIGAGMAGLIDGTTRLVWMESPGSGTMEVQDVPAIVAAAKARGVLTGCDNTWATALNFKPLAHGVDIVAEALTKYAGGHSDLLMGAVTVADITLRDRIKALLGALGIGVSPDEAALVLRGLETMAVRLAHVGRVAEDFARRLEAHPAVEQVLHPALSSCPGHAHFRRDFAGASGLFAVLLKPGTVPLIGPALDRLKVFAIGASWGGTRSLVAPMAVAGERTAVPWTPEGALVRISIGLEDRDDLWTDLTAMMDTFAGG